MKGVGYLALVLPTRCSYWRDVVAWTGGDPSRVTVMQDYTPPHYHKDVLAWFAAKQRLELMVWPPSSPDLYPIENLWAILKRRIAQRPVKPTTVAKMRDAIEEEYAANTGQEVFDIIGSMLQRAEQVIEAEGGPNGY